MIYEGIPGEAYIPRGENVKGCSEKLRPFYIGFDLPTKP
jgi:hypothetical protein